MQARVLLCALDQAAETFLNRHIQHLESRLAQHATE
jgi:hypothetical protein